MIEYIICAGVIVATTVYNERRLKKKQEYADKVLEGWKNLSEVSLKLADDYDILVKILLDIYTQEELDAIYKSELAKKNTDTDEFMQALGQMIKKKENTDD